MSRMSQASLIVAAALGPLSGSLAAHDIYTELRSQTGLPCCGGDPRTGDCEPVTYRMLPNGNALVRSKRYGATIQVARARITWASVPGSRDEAHWCGAPRVSYFGNGIRQPPLQYPPDDTDPRFVTICAYIDPGGT